MNEYEYRIPLFGPNYSNIRIIRIIRSNTGLTLKINQIKKLLEEKTKPLSRTELALPPFLGSYKFNLYNYDGIKSYLRRRGGGRRWSGCRGSSAGTPSPGRSCSPGPWTRHPCKPSLGLEEKPCNDGSVTMSHCTLETLHSPSVGH